MNLALNTVNLFASLGFPVAASKPVARGLRIIPTTAPVQSIDKGATLVVERPEGMTITCTHGSLWITHDGDAKDLMLAAGDRYTSERTGRMLVYGLESSAAHVA
jgi:hypothetical protein